MKKFIISLVALMLIIPSISLAKMKAPDVLDTEKILTDESLSKYKSVGVKMFAIDDIKYENVDDEEMKQLKHHIKDWQEKLAKTVARNLEDDGINAFVIKEDGSNAGKADMIVDGSITKIDLGSAVGRIMWGWGAGQAGIEVKGELKDAKSGDALVKFEHENSSGLGDGEKWSLLEREVSDLGDKLSEFIEKLRK